MADPTDKLGETLPTPDLLRLMIESGFDASQTHPQSLVRFSTLKFAKLLKAYFASSSDVATECPTCGGDGKLTDTPGTFKACTTCAGCGRVVPASRHSASSAFLTDVCEALFGCFVAPGYNDDHERIFTCSVCEERIDIANWVLSKHADDCLINRVRDYLAEHRPESCAPYVVFSSEEKP